MNLIFQVGDPIITVKNSKGELDEDSGKKIRGMFDTPDCNLKEQARKNYLSKFWWGPYVFNPVFDNKKDGDGWRRIIALRHLPSESFWAYGHGSTDEQGNEIHIVHQSELLPGISLFSDNKIHYWQVNQSDSPEEITYAKDIDGNFILSPDDGKRVRVVFHNSPENDISGDPAGIPYVYPCIPIIEKSNFAWLAQMQRVGRVGAPSIFIEVTDPMDRKDPVSGVTTNDLEYAQQVLANWSGGGSQFPLLGNMKAVPIPANESDSAIETIRELAKMLNDQFSPIGQITSGDGSKMGGSDEAAVSLLVNHISGILENTANDFVPVAQMVLRVNGYKDYSVTIEFPTIEFRDGQLDLQRAAEGRLSGDISPQEHRKLIGMTPASDEEIKIYSDYWSALLQPQTSPKAMNREVVETTPTAQTPIPKGL